jgi:hypothetical protein
MKTESTALDRIETVAQMDECYVSNSAVIALVAHARALEAVLDVACKLTPNPIPRTFDVVADQGWADLTKAAAATATTRAALEKVCAETVKASIGW